MASITIRRIDEETKQRLRVRAARHGRSMEEEAREILRTGVAAKELSGRDFTTGPSGRDLWEFIRARVAPLGGVELPEIPREPIREPPSFD